MLHLRFVRQQKRRCERLGARLRNDIFSANARQQRLQRHQSDSTASEEIEVYVPGARLEVFQDFRDRNIPFALAGDVRDCRVSECSRAARRANSKQKNTLKEPTFLMGYIARLESRCFRLLLMLKLR
jgi:hypothetical protein